MQALVAGMWGGVAGASLLIGALIGIYARVSQKIIGLIMAIGAGVLISSVSFELMEEAFRVGGFDAAAIGLLLGAFVFFAADWIVNRLGAQHRKRSKDDMQAKHGEGGSASALVIGALLDGIPESLAIGIGLLQGGKVSAVMVAAVFMSNIPESLSAAAGMKKAGRSTRYILTLWTIVMMVSALAAAAGYIFLAGASGNTTGAISAFAAGAILTMLASTMMPEAYDEGGAAVGLVTTIGFLIAFVLSKMEG